ncbi:MAG: DUF748 domain-containing protein, partial [Flavobacteriales bacterium]
RLLKLPLDSSGAAGAPEVSESNVFVLLAEYIGYLGREFVASDYSARSIRFTDCAVRFADYTPRLPFRYDVEGITLSAARITTGSDTGRMALSALLGGSGAMDAKAVFDPKAPANFSIALQLRGLRLAALDPYARWYAAHPIEDGVLGFVTSTTVRDGLLDSQNALRIDRLRFGKRIEEHDTAIVVLPLRLAAGLLKDVHGVVALDIPVGGNLRDPAFRVWPIVWQVLKNLVVKAVSAPGRALARAFGDADEGALDELRFEHAQTAIGKRQEKDLRLLARVLKGKPELRAALLPLADAQAERDELALWNAKRAFLIGNALPSAHDSARIAGLAITDSLFARWVEERTPGLSGKPVQARCMAIAGPEGIAALQAGMEQRRQSAIAAALRELGADAGRFAFRAGSAEELQGRVGRPGYRILFEADE